MRPLIRLDGVVKTSTVPPLRLDGFVVGAGDRLALSGLDRSAAEMLVHLVTGAALPDEGTVEIDGRDTRTIATDAEWLTSLDRFGLVTDRAILIDALSIESNLALPLTVAIDPVAGEVRETLRELAALVGLAAERLPAPAASLSALERALVHLARALAPRPAFLMLEHPTAGLHGAGESAALGGALRTAAGVRGIGWLAITGDPAFARASGSRRVWADLSRGTVRDAGFPLAGRLRRWLTQTD